MEQIIEKLQAQLEALKTIVEEEVKKRRHLQKSLDQALHDIGKTISKLYNNKSYNLEHLCAFLCRSAEARSQRAETSTPAYLNASTGVF